MKKIDKIVKLTSPHLFQLLYNSAPGEEEWQRVLYRTDTI